MRDSAHPEDETYNIIVSFEPPGVNLRGSCEILCSRNDDNNFCFAEYFSTSHKKRFQSNARLEGASNLST
jgi:hypothetical protein